MAVCHQLAGVLSPAPPRMTSDPRVCRGHIRDLTILNSVMHDRGHLERIYKAVVKEAVSAAQKKITNATSIMAGKRLLFSPSWSKGHSNDTPDPLTVRKGQVTFVVFLTVVRADGTTKRLTYITEWGIYRQSKGIWKIGRTSNHSPKASLQNGTAKVFFESGQFVYYLYPSSAVQPALRTTPAPTQQAVSLVRHFM